ncbi:MAG TPA: MmcQ/YjbR family DNA-binding protein [Streptosporangiaceae bacterium]|nr:MmcQ/YjbR family DNA-binding protein [Streptosporangiaceae bacterium]
MITADQVRQVAMSLPRTTEGLVRDRVKFYIGRIVYVAISPDETTMGFGFPKEERAALIASEPDKFFMPIKSEERYNWVESWMAALDPGEMREYVIDAWCMVVAKKVSAAYLAGLPVPEPSPPSRTGSRSRVPRPRRPR